MLRSKNSRYHQKALQAVKKAFAAAALYSSIEEGEEHVCRNCDVPEKPCVDEPLFECSAMILGGTHLESARERSRELMKAELPRCASCGRELSSAQVQRSPLCELCTGCRSRIKNASTGRRSKNKRSP